MATLWKYLRPHQVLIFLSLLFATGAQLLTLVDPIIFGKIVDEYTNPAVVSTAYPPDIVSQVLVWLGIAFVVALGARLFKALQEYTTRLTVARFGRQIFDEGLRQTLRLSFPEFEESSSGETLSILQKVKTDTERFVQSFINVLFSTLVGVAFLIWYSITKNGVLIAFFLLGIVLLGSLSGLLSKQIKSIQRSINKQTNRLSGVITESLRNVELIRSLGLTFSEIRHLKELTLKIFELECTKAKRVQSLSFFQGITLALLRHSILFILLWLIFHKQLSNGELITMQFISTTIFGPLQDLGNLILQYREVEASIQHFDVLMKKPVEQRPPQWVEIDQLHTLRFEDVVFRHKTASYNAIDGISFEVKKGETIAFVGPSGSGKSTLVKLLVGLYTPQQGKVYFNEHLSSTIRYNPLRRQIGFVSQDTHLFAGSIADNLRLVKPDATEEQLRDAMEKASATRLLTRSADGLNTMLGENGLKLSGGEKQRLSIARALLRQPQLLIFDEATSALDSITEEDITDTIREISQRRGQITILIAHRLSTILHADVIYVLEKGKIVEMGNHDDLLKQKGLYYAMWRQQIGERRND
ncbi:ABC transporter ATP-binding protein [Xanthocytophaga flava]|uniref:ABC transporter ATP-binding protein n=1 Tax=Xanthocytophaga flava TaxID=3048013 RepID=UPI0028D5172E|nr:ABC transporter ATP-binding protein [Xanthocytophaga flavus]MDJ1471569.1 ABC transporter ATP-binding protein [Xanthocytophaga flavus]